MDSSDIQYAVKVLTAHAKSAICQELHHPRKWRHLHGEVCPVICHLYKQVDILEDFAGTEAWRRIDEYQPPINQNIQAIGTWFDDDAGAGESECQMIGEYNGYEDDTLGHMLTLDTPTKDTHLINITHWKRLQWPEQS